MISEIKNNVFIFLNVLTKTVKLTLDRLGENVKALTLGYRTTQRVFCDT